MDEWLYLIVDLCATQTNVGVLTTWQYANILYNKCNEFMDDCGCLAHMVQSIDIICLWYRALPYKGASYRPKGNSYHHIELSYNGDLHCFQGL